MNYDPSTPEELASIIHARTKPLSIQGLGTKAALGYDLPFDILSLKRLSGITLYEPEELVLEAQAATPLKVIQKLLNDSNQRLAFDPPDYSNLLGAKNSGSIASLLTCNLSGPRRLTQGAARDHVLGIAGVSGRGEIFKGGGRVVKNVTGYDIPKLMAGSYGTLAALTSVTFKVLPRPEAECSVIVPCTDYVAAGEVMRMAMQLSVDVSCAAYLPGTGVLIRLEGIASSVADRRARLVQALHKEHLICDQTKSQKLWRDMRDVAPFCADLGNSLWRISVPPTEGPHLATRLENTYGANILLDWSGGLLWVEMPQEHRATDIRHHIESGHAMLFRAASDVKQVIDVFQPQSSDLAKLSHRVKQSFDPVGILNPGRLYRTW